MVDAALDKCTYFNYRYGFMNFSKHQMYLIFCSNAQPKNPSTSGITWYQVKLDSKIV